MCLSLVLGRWLSSLLCFVVVIGSVVIVKMLLLLLCVCVCVVCALCVFNYCFGA